MTTEDDHVKTQTHRGNAMWTQDRLMHLHGKEHMALPEARRETEQIHTFYCIHICLQSHYVKENFSLFTSKVNFSFFSQLDTLNFHMYMCAKQMELRKPWGGGITHLLEIKEEGYFKSVWCLWDQRKNRANKMKKNMSRRKGTMSPFMSAVLTC